MSNSDIAALLRKDPPPLHKKIRLHIIPDEEPEQERGTRGARKSTTIRVDRLTPEERARARAECPEAAEPYWRPQTREDCAQVERPCPFVGCPHNLYLDVSRTTGNIRLNFPDREPGDMPPDESCAWDVAEACAPQGLPLARVGELLGVTRERARQLEEALLRKLAIPASRIR